jgi:hypothetical protein
MGIKKFFKKNLRDIATVVGFAIGGPAGAAIGQGVGSLGEGRSLKKSLVSSAKVYGGANLAAGAGITPETITPGSGSFLQLNPGIMPGTDINSIPGFLQQTGATIATGGSMSGVTQGLKDLSLMQKLGLGGLGLAGMGAFDELEQPKGQMPGPAGGQYLTQGLRPATVSDVYGTGNMRGLPSVPGVQGSSVAMDPVSMAYMELLRKQQEESYGNLAFPEFSQQPIMTAKTGGIARLADGGELPEVDLRFTGGGTNDPMGSGDEDTIPALLADGEFVMTKQAVKGIGNGDHDQGIAMLYAMMDNNENKAQRMGLGRA